MTKNLSVYALITARGGSKSIPRKNIALLAGKPLIVWTIEEALKSTKLDRVIVSTDDEEIAKLSLEHGAEVPFIRSKDLAQDNTPHYDVVEDVITWLKFNEEEIPDYVMLLQPTSPFRKVKDIDEVIQLAQTKKSKAVVSVSEVAEHPYLTYQIIDNTLHQFVETDIKYKRRQDLPILYLINGAIYLNETESFLKDKKFVPSGAVPYVMPKERSLDIDTPFDLYLANLILKDQN